jgi:hypothetical protein
MKQTFFTISILTILSLSVLAQNQIPSPRYGASVVDVEYEVDSVTQAWAHYLLFGDVNYTENPFAGMPSFYAFTHYETYTEVEPLAINWDSIFFSSGQIALNFNNEYIVLIGGNRTDANGNPSSNNRTMLYHIATGSMYDGALEPFPSVGFMAYCDMGQGKIFFNGGEGHFYDGPHTWVLDMNTMTYLTKQNCPKALSGHKAISDTTNHKVYLFGGIDDQGNNNFECYEYNTQNNSWGFGPSIQNYPANEWTGYAASGNTLNPNEIFLAGGQKYDPNKSTNSIAFSSNLYTIKLVNGNMVATLITNTIPPMIGGVGWVSLENTNDTVFYMFGGINSISSTGDTTFTNNFYRYNQTTQQIQQYDTLQQTWGGILSINEAEFDKNINLQIYPNPATSEISLVIPNNESIVSIKIYNQNGQLVKQIFKPNAEKINISDLKAGLYFIRTDTDTNRYLSKMIKD